MNILRIYILLLMIFILSACLKQVETLYFEDKDMTLFVTKPFKSTHRYKEIELEASKNVICFAPARFRLLDKGAPRAHR